MNRLWRIGAALVLIVLALPAPATRAQQPGVSDGRFARLARGINLTGWFWYAPPTLEEVDAVYTADDFALIHDLGFTYVRVPFDMGFLLDEADPDLLNDETLAVFDRGLDRILAADLAVIVDLHSTSLADSDASVYSGALEQDDAYVETFIAFWQSLAGHLSVRDPEYVFVEPMNEPVFEDNPARWPPMQERIVAAIREVAPEVTILATGALWSGIDTFLTLEPLDDPNLVYNFHFYEPFLFTHQGATWGWDVVAPLRDVPYPSNPEALAPLVDDAPTAEIANYLRWYGEERWDAASIDARIGEVAAWAEQHEVRVICNEFGAYGDYAPVDDRVTWIRDTRTALEHYGFGWAMWDYDQGFGLVLRTGSTTIVDEAVAGALGLTVP